MQEIEYFKGQWGEFKEWEKREHSFIREEISSLRNSVESLKLWRASVVGMAGLVGLISGFVASYIHSLHLGG